MLYFRGLEYHFRSLFILVILSTISSSIGAQVTFEAKANASQVVENGVFTVEFQLQNAISNAFTPPDFRSFKVVSGPSTSQSTSIINGKMSQSMSLNYTLLANQVGKHTIGPATMVVNGNRLQTKPFVIEVVKGAPGSGTAAAGEIFLSAEIDTQDIYPGQQQYLYYKIYTQINIRDYSSVSEDDYENFYFRYVKDFDRRPQQVVIEGKQYTSQVIKTVALFPQKTGTFEIDPLILNVWIPKPGADRSRSFFRSYNHINKQVSSNSVQIIVRPLPADAPASFSGGVGKFNFSSSIDRQRLTTDDAIVLRMRVVGDGDIRRWSAPQIGLDANFEVFEPNVLDEKSVDQNGTVMSEKTFEYLMIPRKTGTLRFSVPFSYFNPDSANYVTLKSRQFTIQVTQGSNVAGSVDDVIGMNEESLEIQPLKARAGLRKEQKSFFLSPFFWVLILIPLLGLIFTFFWQRKRNAYQNIDPGRRRMLEAKKKAMVHLKVAEQYVEEGTPKEFYEALSNAIFGYVSDKLKIPISELSATSIETKVDQLNVSEEQKNALMSILSKCQFYVYGGGSSDNERELVFDETLNLISVFETELGS